MNGCHNRKPLHSTVIVQAGWYMDGYTRTPKMVSIPNPMQKSCQYQKNDKYQDPGCNGCKHKDAK